MKLYLVQHGLALSEEIDPKKGLSQQGRLEAKRMAAFLSTKNVKVDVIWHSKKERSYQTAQIFLENMPGAEILSRDDLNPQDAVENFPVQIQSLNKDLMIVGHLPFLQKLASLLLLASADYGLFTFKNSGVVYMEYKNTWQVLWIVTPDLI